MPICMVHRRVSNRFATDFNRFGRHVNAVKVLNQFQTDLTQTYLRESLKVLCEHLKMDNIAIGLPGTHSAMALSHSLSLMLSYQRLYGTTVI